MDNSKHDQVQTGLAADSAVLKAAKNLFISITAHKLLSPLTIIKWNIEILNHMDNLDPKIAESLDDISKSTKKLEDFSNVMVRIMDIKTGGESSHQQIKETDLYDLTTSILDEFSDLTENIPVKIHNDLKKSYKFKTDDFILRSIIRSFINNALSYSTEKKPIEIGVNIEETKIIFYVKDRGIGIPESEKEMIFQPFFRSTNAQKLTVKGSGLDLYISMLSLEGTGDTIWFESTEGHGSTFYFALSL